MAQLGSISEAESRVMEVLWRAGRPTSCDTVVSVLTRERWLSFESQRLLKRMFGGRLAPLVAHFGQHHRLSKQDVAELKRLVAQMSDDD